MKIVVLAFFVGIALCTASQWVKAEVEENQCPARTYYSTSYRRCRGCYKNCETCSGRWSSQCITCKEGHVKNANTKRCDIACDESEYAYWGRCRKCDSSCKTCSGAGRYRCTECNDRYEKNTRTRKCELKKSTSCTDGNYLNPTIGYCYPCSSSCKTCIMRSTKCTSCDPLKSRKLVKNRCITIQSSITAETQHALTYSNSLKPVERSLSTFTVKAKCPDGKYNKANSEECRSCPINCATCISSGICLTCKNGFEKVGNSCHIKTTGTDPVCEDGQYLLKYGSRPGRCYSCKRNCVTCTGYSKCTSCISGYKLKYSRFCFPG